MQFIPLVATKFDRNTNREESWNRYFPRPTMEPRQQAQNRCVGIPQIPPRIRYQQIHRPQVAHLRSSVWVFEANKVSS